jgi:hypothetical protein
MPPIQFFAKNDAPPHRSLQIRAVFSYYQLTMALITQHVLMILVFVSLVGFNV